MLLEVLLLPIVCLKCLKIKSDLFILLMKGINH